MTGQKFDGKAVAQLLRDFADKLDKEEFYVADNSFEVMDFESVKVETVFRESGTGPSLKMFLEERINNV